MTPADLPTLTDGTVTLRARRDGDAEAPGGDWRPAPGEQGSLAAFVVVHDERVVGEVELVPREPGTGALGWALLTGQRGRGYAARAVRVLTDWALSDTGQGGLGLDRVDALVDPADPRSLRVATRAGLRREGVRRVVSAGGPEAGEYVVLARLATDPPLSDPAAFRGLLNSFLPRTRAIAQLLVRDHDDRVLLCQLTYKPDWDLPGGVVERGESPRAGVAREVAEELGLDLRPGDLLLADWLPPWGGWDDALCLVFDGGRHDASLLDALVREQREIRDAEFCTLAQAEERCRDFTVRRIRAALADPPYTESGRP